MKATHRNFKNYKPFITYFVESNTHILCKIHGHHYKQTRKRFLGKGEKYIHTRLLYI